MRQRTGKSSVQVKPVPLPEMPTEKIIVPKLPDWLNRRVLALQYGGKSRGEGLRTSPLLVLFTTLTLNW